jgi:hypothetical protein
MALYPYVLTQDLVTRHFYAPEPATLTLLGLGAFGILARRRRR